MNSNTNLHISLLKYIFPLLCQPCALTSSKSVTEKQLEFIDRVIEVAESYENFDITKEEAIKKLNDLKFQFDRLPTKSSKNKTEQKLHITDTSRVSNKIEVLSTLILLDNDLSDSITYLKNISIVY